MACLFIHMSGRAGVYCEDIHCDNRNKNLTEMLHEYQGRRNGWMPGRSVIHRSSLQCTVDLFPQFLCDHV